METGSKRNNLNNPPLPEDHSSAIARNDSSRNNGGHERQNMVDKSATATPCISSTQEPQTAAAERVSPAKGTTKAGKPRQRMKWTYDLNEFGIRTYFEVTKAETQIIGYRTTLHQKFIERYPQGNVTEQRVADLRRVIVANKLVPQAVIDKIKQEVAESLEQPGINNSQEGQQQVGQEEPDT